MLDMRFCRGSIILLTAFCSNAVVAYGAKDSDTSENLSHENYEELYRRGREAYLENNFEDCVKLIEASLRDYKEYNKLVNQCRLKCKKRVASYKPAVVQAVQEYKHYEGLIRETLCLINCKRGKINPNRSEQIIDAKLVEDFESLKTYDYLQLCYFQTKKFQEAANTAFTYMIYNPEHKIMSENLQYYLNIEGVDKHSLTNLEEPAFWKWYEQGLAAYAKEDYETTVASIENALKLFMQEEELCRVQCEKPFDMGWHPDFVSSVSNHFTFCVKCKLNCATKLHYLQAEEDEDLMPSFFHYLQYGYFKVLNYEAAADCALTYLYMRPDTVDMENNLQYYRTASGGYSGKVRQEAKTYYDRETDELELLQFIEKNFVFDESSTHREDILSEDETSSGDFSENETSSGDFSENETSSGDFSEDETCDLAEDTEVDSHEKWVKWSSKRGEYTFEDESEDDFADEIKNHLLSPPPIVKYEL